MSKALKKVKSLVKKESELERRGENKEEDSEDKSEQIPTVEMVEGEMTDIDFEDIVGTEVAKKFQHILCYDCNEKEFYKIVGKMKRTKDGAKPTFEKDGDTEWSVTISSANTRGIFAPITVGGKNKEIQEF